VLVFVASAAAEEPKGLDGLPWGSSPAKIREVLKTHGSLAGSEQDGVEVCEGSSLGDLIGKLTLVNVPSRGLAAWRFALPTGGCGPTRGADRRPDRPGP